MDLAKYLNWFDLSTINPPTPNAINDYLKNNGESLQKSRRLDSIKHKSDHPYSETKSITNSKLEWIEEYVGSATRSINAAEQDLSFANQSIGTNSISGNLIS